MEAKELKDIKYMKMITKRNVPEIELEDIKDFLELMKVCSSKVVFIDHKREYFAILFNGTACKIRCNNYKTILDMLEGTSKGFSDGNKYEDARKRGFDNYEEYSEAIQLGYENREEYIEAKNMGFRGQMEKTKEIMKGKKKDWYKKLGKYKQRKYESVRAAIIELDRCFTGKTRVTRAEGCAYRYAKKNGFKNFDEFIDAISKSFFTAEDYHDGIKKGFSDGFEYKEAKERGFENPNEFNESLKLGIKTKSDYDLYIKLEEIKKTYSLKTTDEAILFKMLSDLEPQQRISAEKIWKKLEELKSKYKDRHGNLPEWFSGSFGNKDSVKKYLAESKQVSQIGWYDKEGEVFNRIVQKGTIVFIDGSNVACYTKPEDGKGHVKYIRLVVNALREKGYSQIGVFIDASLWHKVDDWEEVDDLKKEGLLIEVSAHRQADEFILKYVKEYVRRGWEVLVITHDLFKDWKEKDEWVRKNIEKYRVGVTIDPNGIVKFDEKIEKISE